MAEYIEREAVMQKFADHVRRSNNSDFAPAPTWNEAVQIVEDFPAADVRPVVRGKWNRTDAYPHRLYCSFCHKTYLKNDELLERWEFPLNFCPNCGADMRAEEGE